MKQEHQKRIDSFGEFLPQARRAIARLSVVCAAQEQITD
jgi:hypothetical protein